ncbi:ATP synthase subunit E [Deinococcus radiopugnans]|uniref:ATP synthase subunit E n=2 Tax=Deinococcus radiopugnans TaxID=57497 RepID=A0A0A7KCY3_9DEIO|nr:V-type ATP synthase subunit E [Deinococcus radiopugnans]AIZ43960.1 ATP synthase subunit E [Deinococcus radiopugnans]MBB6017226.1 V/A-type H+-transporting ATPase subunit E [Deinococcus radiopugnans ATCC 19172]TNM70540.1 V-type ATP synthase subunit E [Deinococcus radiopugnans ATCC 19172]
MALDKLLQNEAQTEIERIRAEARERADAIVAAANERAEALVSGRTRALDTARQAGLVRARSAADLDSNAQRLAATDSLQTQAFQTAEQYIRSSVSAPEYPQIMIKLISEGLQALPGAVAVETQSSEQDAARRALEFLGGEAATLEVRVNDSVQTGVRLIGPDGKTSIQNTLVGRLERVREELAPQITRLLAE